MWEKGRSKYAFKKPGAQEATPALALMGPKGRLEEDRSGVVEQTQESSINDNEPRLAAASTTEAPVFLARLRVSGSTGALKDEGPGLKKTH